jgi:hypothetical protein
MQRLCRMNAGCPIAWVQGAQDGYEIDDQQRGKNSQKIRLAPYKFEDIQQ